MNRITIGLVTIFLGVSIHHTHAIEPVYKTTPSSTQCYDGAQLNAVLRDRGEGCSMSQKTSSLLMELTLAVSELEAEHGAALSGYTQARSELFGVIAQRDELLDALIKAIEALAGGLWDYGPGQDEHDQRNQVVDECRAAIAKVEGGAT